MRPCTGAENPSSAADAGTSWIWPFRDHDRTGDAGSGNILQGGRERLEQPCRRRTGVFAVFGFNDPHVETRVARKSVGEGRDGRVGHGPAFGRRLALTAINHDGNNAVEWDALFIHEDRVGQGQAESHQCAGPGPERREPAARR